MKTKKFLFMFISIIAFALLFGCSQSKDTANQDNRQTNESQNDDKAGQNNNNSNTNEEEPVPELTVDGLVEITILAALSEEDFQTRYMDPIKKKFPQVTLRQVVTSSDLTLEDLMIASPPDLIDYGITNMLTLIDLDIPLDLDPLVEKYNIDLSRINSQIMKDIRSYSTNEELTMLPFGYQPFVLYYNKDIFDMFGVDYPKKGSTWNELIELAKQLSRTADGVNYRGLDVGISPNRMQTQLSAPFVDPNTKKSLIGSHPAWDKFFETFHAVYNIQGNYPEGSRYGDGTNKFRKDRTLAMFPHLFSSFTLADINNGLNLGVTSFPQFDHLPGVSTGVFGQGLVVSKTSKNPDAAFAIANYFTSDEIQIELGKTGNVTPLVSKEVQSKLLEGNPLADGLDIDAIHYLQPADPYVRTKWDKIALDTLRFNILRELAAGNGDVNTLRRQADEIINQEIAANP